METAVIDLTTLITIVSDICRDDNIKNRFGDINEWKNKNMNVYNLILDEDNDPVFPKLAEKLKTFNLTTTQIVWDKFIEMMMAYGSNSEVERTNNLKINIIEEKISNEFGEINNKQWTELNKSSFGTAHKKGYILVTGNIGALKDAIAQGITLRYIAHRSRCFVGKKFEKMNL